MLDLLADGDRAAHVPGVLRRRMAMTSRPQGDATRRELLRACPATASDASWLLHDFAACFHELPEEERTANALRRCLGDGASAVTLEELWVRSADVFVAAAALGDLPLLQTLLEAPARRSQSLRIDFTKVMHVACANGHADVVDWLWSATEESAVDVRDAFPMLRSVEAIRAAFHDGAQRARDRRVMVGTTHTEKANDTCGPLSAEVLALATAVEAIQISDTESMAHAALPPTAYVDVLTNSSLIAQIGVFLEHPQQVVNKLREELECGEGECASRPRDLYRLAIIRGSLSELQAACIVHPLAASEFPLAVHYAACEGRVEMLEWLYRRRPQGVNCRPDTMAMAVRCGWPRVVEWLQVHCPESGQSMAQHAIADAARWGHVDVLRVCHGYALGEFTDATVVCAARTGQLDAVKLLHSLDSTLNLSAAMDVAVKHGHVPVVRWLHENRLESVTSERLAIALRDVGPNDHDFMQFMWSAVDTKDTTVKGLAAGAFAKLCVASTVSIVEIVLALVVDEQTVANDGLHAAMRARRCDVVELLLRRAVIPRDEAIDGLLRLALESREDDLIRWAVHLDGVSVEHLDTFVKYAATKAPWCPRGWPAR